MKKAIIIGNGPSLKKIDMSKLKNIDTFSFNRAYLAYEEWGFVPTFYACIDRERIRHCYDGVRMLLPDTCPTKKIFLRENQYVMDNFLKEDKVIVTNYDRINWLGTPDEHGIYAESEFPKHMTDAPNCAGSVSVYAVQLAYAMGYTHIGMVGVDANYKSDGHLRNGKGGINHFRPDYNPPDVVSEETVGNDLDKWKMVRDQLAKSKIVKIFSCVSDSKVNGVIPYIHLDEFLNMEER